MTVTDLHPITEPAVSDPEPTMAELEVWVTTWFTEILERRSTNRRRWCARWWAHPEAVTRMRILMLGHRQVVTRGSVLDQSTWMLDHLDRHLDVLQSPDGPFAACSLERHAGHRGLQVEAVR